MGSMRYDQPAELLSQAKSIVRAFDTPCPSVQRWAEVRRRLVVQLTSSAVCLESVNVNARVVPSFPAFIGCLEAAPGSVPAGLNSKPSG